VLALIAATGQRRGEALALRWEHINFKDGALKVAATLSRVGDRLLITEPKSPRSRRTVPLSPAIVALLKSQRAAQAAERLHAGNQWTDSGLVFTTEFGTPVDPRNVLRTIEQASPRRATRTSVCTPCGQRRGGLARAGRAYQGGSRPAGAQLDQHHRRHLRPHVGRDHASRDRRPDQ
jgi:integrase